MAYATRYIFNFVSATGKDTVIRIKEDGYQGAAVLRPLGGHPVLKMECDGCVRGMSLEIPAECLVEDEFVGLYTPDPRRYMVELLVDGAVSWKGFVTPELYSAPWVDPPYDVAVIATDGLGELKQYDFPAFGQHDVASVLSAILGITGLSMPVRLISDMVHDREQEPMHTLATASMDFGTLAGKTCYDVLQDILSSFHATIQQVGGAWLLVRETDVAGRLDGGTVTDCGGRPHPVRAFGTARLFDTYPVGHLRMEIVPAKRTVRVSAANDPLTGMLEDGDMVAGTWSGNGTHYPADGGFYALQTGAAIHRDVVMPQFVPYAGDVADLLLVVRARQADPAAAHSVKVRVSARGMRVNAGTYVTYYLANDAMSSSDLYWTDTVKDLQFELHTSKLGNSSDCQEVEVSIPLRLLLSQYISSGNLSWVNVRIAAADAAIYVHSAHMSAVTGYKGFETALAMGNGARGTVKVAPVMADTYGYNKGLSFLKNSAKNVYGDSVRIINTWSRDGNEYPYGEFVARDYALSFAVPRLRLAGILHTPHALPATFYRTAGLVFMAEQWSYDLLDDEADISLLSLPASSLQVVGVSQTPLAGSDEVADTSVSVMPASLLLDAGDTSPHVVMVGAAAGVQWSVTGLPPWLSATPGSGQGPGTVSVSATANPGGARGTTILIGGIPVQVSQAAAQEHPTLTIATDVASPAIALAIGGAPASYYPGMGVPAGATVAVTVSKAGYVTLTDTFTMPPVDTVKEYTLTPVAIDASVSYPGSVSSAAQDVPFEISDPQSHGWLLEYSGPDAYGMVAGAGVVSGNALSEPPVLRGTGNARVYLSVSANAGQSPRPINVAPFYFKDLESGNSAPLAIVQAAAPVPVAGVTLNHTELTLLVGDTAELVATVSPPDAANPSVEWSTSAPSVAGVTQGGLVTAAGPGGATVTVTTADGGHTDSCVVTVEDLPQPDEHTLTIVATPQGASVVLTVGGAAVDYTPAMPVATGVEVAVTVSKAGYVTLTDTFTMPPVDTVKEYTLTPVAVPVAGVTLNLTELTLYVGDTAELVATVSPPDAANPSVEWSTSAPSVAGVTQGGLVTAAGPGGATVTVTTADGGHTDTCVVQVITGLLVSPAHMEWEAQDTEEQILSITAGEPWTLSIEPDGHFFAEFDGGEGSSAVSVRPLSANTAGAMLECTLTVTGENSGHSVTVTLVHLEDVGIDDND